MAHQHSIGYTQPYKHTQRELRDTVPHYNKCK